MDRASVDSTLRTAHASGPVVESAEEPENVISKSLADLVTEVADHGRPQHRHGKPPDTSQGVTRPAV